MKAAHRRMIESLVLIKQGQIKSATIYLRSGVSFHTRQILGVEPEAVVVIDADNGAKQHIIMVADVCAVTLEAFPKKPA